MLNGVFYSLNIIVWLGLTGLLAVLCFQTKSKGLILISVMLLTGGIFDWVFEQIGELYVHRSVESKMNGEETQNMNTGEFLMTLTLIKLLLYNCLCLLGSFLIFTEWRQGKFRQPQPESS